MSITFKILLNKRKDSKNNIYPVILRIYKDSVSKEHSLNIKIRETEWDEATQLVAPSNASFEVLNARIQQVRSKVQKQLLLAEINKVTDLEPEDIIAAIAGSKSLVVKEDRNDIIKYGSDLVIQLTNSGRVGNAFVYSCAVSKLKSFINTNKFSFESLTYKKLNEFQDSMLADDIKVNSISVYMRTIRAIYNRAIKEGIVSATSYPFTSYRIKNEKTVSRTLTLLELKGIIQLDLVTDTPIWHWRNYFLLSFCLIGINFSDLLTLKGSNYVNGRIVFRRMKTGKVYTIRLHKQAMDILSVYVDISSIEKEQLLFPVLKQTKDQVTLKKDMWQAIKTCNEYLDRIAKELKISKEVTTYYARYTWANIARGLGYSKDIIGQALGHSYGNATTSIYLDDYDNEIIDEANEKVMKAVFNTYKPRRKK